MKETLRGVSVFLLGVSGIVLIALQLKPSGWLVLLACALSLFLNDTKFAKDVFLIVLSLSILGVTPINTDISVAHILFMSFTLAAAVVVPYLISRFVYKDHVVRFPWHHGRNWYSSEVIYIAVAAAVSYLLLPFYLSNTQSYLNWPSGADSSSLVRLFIGTNGLGIWDELFFVTT